MIATQTRFEEFRIVWHDNRRERGLGALVFVSGDTYGDSDGIECEYWTLGELRTYLRRMDENDEVIFKLLSLAEKGGGFPVVVFSSLSRKGDEELFFSHVQKKRVT